MDRNPAPTMKECLPVAGALPPEGYSACCTPATSDPTHIRGPGLFTMLCGALLGFMLSPVSLRADPIDEAVDKGIAFLVSEQDGRGAIRENGAHETAMTALSALAMAAAGHQPSSPTPEGIALRKALGFLLSQGRQDQDGYFGARDSSRMYGHGITALTLSALLGMGTDAAQDAAIHGACEKAVHLILRAQAVTKRPEHAGGWRYTPTSTDSDLSITIWQLMALRSAKNAGLDVPKDAIDNAVAYLKRAHVPNGKDWKTAAGFRYVHGSAPSWSTAAEGLLALQLSGAYDAPEVVSTAEWLLHNPPDPSKAKSLWFYYGTYYYAQGMYQRGGEAAEESAKRVREVLLKLQDPNGSWKMVSDLERNKVYCTAMALLSLSVKYHFLPIYQR
jgi:hypothetical protein